jgi:copper chaperone CopZ
VPVIEIFNFYDNRRKAMKQIIRLAIPGIKCNGCVAAIEKELGDESGVIKSEVGLETKTATIESNVSLAVLVDAVKSAGFDATELLSEDRKLPA